MINVIYKYGFWKTYWNVGEQIYSLLGSKTVNEGSRIQIKSVYGRAGVEYAKSIDGVFSLRVQDMENHLGNPYSSIDELVKKDNLIKVDSTRDAVIAFICYVLFSQDDRAVKIRSWLDKGVLKGKPIIYYKELNEPSHATALEWLIDNYHKPFVLNQDKSNIPIITDKVSEYNKINKDFDYTYCYSDCNSTLRHGDKIVDQLDSIYLELSLQEKDLVALYSNHILKRPRPDGSFRKKVFTLPDTEEMALLVYGDFVE